MNQMLNLIPNRIDKRLTKLYVPFFCIRLFIKQHTLNKLTYIFDYAQG